MKSVLNTCNVISNKDSLGTVCSACQKGKFHKLPFSKSTTEYSYPFELVVSDLWSLASINCGNN